ncbi:MAG: hypothetical protein JST30_08195 [Armatimonadetes bacterium]|nr:hypothetical protein [Armatimonadota bacterium]
MGLPDHLSDRPIVEAFFIGAIVIGALMALGTSAPLRAIRPPRLRMRLADGFRSAKPWLGPTLTLTLTAFGLAGMTASRFGAGSRTAVVVASLATLVSSLAATAVFKRLMTDAGEPLRGRTLIGSVGTVCLSIPQDGVGRVTYLAEGQRRVVPAKTPDDGPVDTGLRVIVIDVQSGVAIVEEL